MAEFPELGKHCDVQTCKQLDFLPFLCNGCSGTFCLEHRSKVSHSCTADDQKDEVHVQENSAKTLATTEGHLECSFEECSGHELVPVICEHCQKNYCFRHRHQVDHQCPVLPKKQPRVTPQERIQQIIGKELCKEKKGRGGVRNESRAAKVALMKLKMKATGDSSIPQEERIYLRVLLPFGSKEQEQPLFFSKYWTIGKVIDKIAGAARLKNENNKKTSQRKLRLYHRNTGEIMELQDSLEHLQARDYSQLSSGSTVIIEYVDNECNDVLPNLDKYPT